MRVLALFTAWLAALVLVPAATGDDACHYIKSRRGLRGYETGGPYKLEHFRLTRGRTELRQFLWTHWHDHHKGVAEARVGTVDAGMVTALYVVEPDAQGRWGIDVEIDRPMQPPCTTFHADSLARLPISKPEEDYPSQTLSIWPPDKVPEKQPAESEVKDAKFYRVLLVAKGKLLGDAI
jgi:hypothetical protein